MPKRPPYELRHTLPTPTYGQYLTHAHSHITPDVAATVFFIHSYTIEVMKQTNKQTNKCHASSRESLSVLLPSGQTVNNLIQMILMAKSTPVVRKYLFPVENIESVLEINRS